MKYSKKQKFYILLTGILFILLVFLGKKYLDSRKPISIRLLDSDIQTTRYDDIPRELANTKAYSQMLIGSSTKISAHATIEEVETPGNRYKVKVDSGESIIIQIEDDTLLSDAWMEVDADNNIVNKSSVDLKDISKLENLRSGDRLWIIYEPEFAEYIVPEFLAILK